MTAQILDGKSVAKICGDHTKMVVNTLRSKGFRAPKLAVILVGHDPASSLYVRNKRIACEATGITSVIHQLPYNTDQHMLTQHIHRLNDEEEVDGILVQLPLPPHILTQAIIEAIAFQKDVDGLHPYNMGRFYAGLPLLRPCTPQGIMYLMNHYGLLIKGKKSVVIGRSPIVGRPMALELLACQSTVVICHSHTRHLPEEIADADLVVACLGKPRYISGEWIKKGAIVIDVGIHRLPDHTICGDVDWPTAKQRASWITPVPGGVGPMTIAMLLVNTVMAMQKRLHITEPLTS